MGGGGKKKKKEKNRKQRNRRKRNNDKKIVINMNKKEALSRKEREKVLIYFFYLPLSKLTHWFLGLFFFFSFLRAVMGLSESGRVFVYFLFGHPSEIGRACFVCALGHS